MSERDYYLFKYSEKLARYLEESGRYTDYLPDFQSSHFEINEYFKVVEHRLFHKNQAEYLKILFTELQELHCKLYKNN